MASATLGSSAAVAKVRPPPWLMPVQPTRSDAYAGMRLHVADGAHAVHVDPPVVVGVGRLDALRHPAQRVSAGIGVGVGTEAGLTSHVNREDDESLQRPGRGVENRSTVARVAVEDHQTGKLGVAIGDQERAGYPALSVAGDGDVLDGEAFHRVVHRRNGRVEGVVLFGQGLGPELVQVVRRGGRRDVDAQLFERPVNAWHQTSP